MAEVKKTTAKKTEPKGSFMDQIAGVGLEHISPDDLQVPRLKLLQGLSPELDESASNYDPKAKNGHFYLTIPGENLGKEVEVIPVHQATFWTEWTPGRGGFVARHLPGTIVVDKSDFANWFRPDTGNEIQESRDWVVLVVGHEDIGPVIMSFTSSMIKASKAWMSNIAMQRTPGGNVAPIFAHVWKLISVSQKNEKGSWSSVSTSPEKVRMITEKEYKEIIEPARTAATAMQNQAIAAPPAQKAIANNGGGTVEEAEY